MPYTILVVEDEEVLGMIIRDRLESEGYAVENALDGDEACDKALKGSFNLIVLDVMLPKKDGFSVCRDLRRFGLAMPILMLTARSETPDKVAGLQIGADDYLTKPFSMMELVARIESLIRRSIGKALSGRHLFQFGSVRVDLLGTEVTRHGRAIRLSAREFQLLRFFLKNPGTPLSRDDLLRHVWGFDENKLTRTVDVHVAALRQKLEDDPRRPRFFRTVQGVGYMFRPAY
jgi:two-component system alkaline phosphatase synthesis response regulator PhoP